MENLSTDRLLSPARVPGPLDTQESPPACRVSEVFHPTDRPLGLENHLFGLPERLLYIYLKPIKKHITMEQQLIKKITGGLFGIKMGTKEPKEVAVLLNKLKPINPMMYEDLFNKYKDLVVKTS